MKKRNIGILIALIIFLFSCKKESVDNKENIELPPQISTEGATNITCNSAIISGNISSLGSLTSLVDYGFCYSSTNQNPTINDSKSLLGATSSLGHYSTYISNLAFNTVYFFRAFVVSESMTYYGNSVVFKTLANTDTTGTSGLKIGDNYQGGKVAYFFVPDDPGYVSGEVHGLIVATNDQGFGLQWYNGTNVLIGSTSRNIGTGKSNTNSIIAIQGAGNYAAALCHNLTLGGFNDWYLPSMDELNILYINRTLINGGFMGSNWYYWSSTEADAENAWAQCLADGNQRRDGGNKFCSYCIRPIRTF